MTNNVKKICFLKVEKINKSLCSISFKQVSQCHLLTFWNFIPLTFKFYLKLFILEFFSHVWLAIINVIDHDIIKPANLQIRNRIDSLENHCFLISLWIIDTILQCAMYIFIPSLHDFFYIYEKKKWYLYVSQIIGKIVKKKLNFKIFC